MAKIQYTLTPDENMRIATDKDGNITLIYTSNDYEDDNFDTSEYSGELQNDLLWEMFDHSFEVFDDQGNKIEYNDEGNRK